MKKIIYFAGGCFWGVEAFFKLQKGVLDTTVGYANSNIEFPTYQDVCEGRSTASEAVKVAYDNEETTLSELIKAIFTVVDPTELNKQGPDEGIQYRNGIYFIDKKDEVVIKDTLNEIAKNFKSKIVTEVTELDNFFAAEDYHQDYLDKNPKGYCHIDLKMKK